jgi:hypothetical protein
MLAVPIFLSQVLRKYGKCLSLSSLSSLSPLEKVIKCYAELVPIKSG